METMIFGTALGEFGIGWTDAGIARVQLPGLELGQLQDRLNRGDARPGEPTRAIEAIINLIEDYADGQIIDFSAVVLDLTGVPEFHRKAYGLLAQIGWGQTTTYGAMARQLGQVTLSRAVGQAMGENPIPLILPCHRVLASDGKPGGFSAPGGADAKLKMLALEGVAMGTSAGQMTFGF